MKVELSPEDIDRTSRALTIAAHHVLETDGMRGHRAALQALSIREDIMAQKRELKFPMGRYE